MLLRIGSFAMIIAAGCAQWSVTLASARVELRTLPTEIFEAPANPKEDLVGWVYFLVVESDSEDAVVPVDLKLEYVAAGSVVREEIQNQRALRAVAFPDIDPVRLTGEPPTTPTYWMHAFRIVSQVPAGLKVDEVHARLRMVAGREVKTLEKRIVIHKFAQKTKLIFPFTGEGLITQTGVFESGHRNRSGLYAIDAIGLTPVHAPMLDNSDRAESYAGWGREIIAPAAGTVVFSRNDRPDQPVTGVSDPEYFAPEYPNGGDTGNYVVIDHGNNEFSLIAHLQRGSVRVKAGDEVAQGERLGLLGNSGDTSGPHVHYQLQRGPRWEYSDGLPATFENVKQTTRGSFFSAEPRKDALPGS